MHVATDFAETLVRERPMVKWVLFELIHGNSPILRKIFFAINSFVRGIISIIFGKFGCTSEWSARFAYKNFKGMTEDSIKCLINATKGEKYLLNINPKFLNVISKIKEDKKLSDEKHIELSIHSQGTCKRMIELFINRDDIKNSFDTMKIKVTKIYANNLEVSKGKFTGNIVGQIITKYNKLENIPNGCIFIGDNHDEKVIINSKGKNFEFINLQRIHEK